MSTHFTAHCPLCKVDGPDIRRSAGGVGLNRQEDEWDAFLIEHEWHGPLFLRHEQQNPGTPPQEVG